MRDRGRNTWKIQRGLEVVLREQFEIVTKLLELHPLALRLHFARGGPQPDVGQPPAQQIQFRGFNGNAEQDSKFDRTPMAPRDAQDETRFVHGLDHVLRQRRALGRRGRRHAVRDGFLDLSGPAPALGQHLQGVEVPHFLHGRGHLPTGYALQRPDGLADIRGLHTTNFHGRELLPATERGIPRGEFKQRSDGNFLATLVHESLPLQSRRRIPNPSPSTPPRTAGPASSPSVPCPSRIVTAGLGSMRTLRCMAGFTITSAVPRAASAASTPAPILPTSTARACVVTTVCSTWRESGACVCL